MRETRLWSAPKVHAFRDIAGACLKLMIPEADLP